MTDDAPEKPPTDVGGIAAAQLRSFVERIERLEEEKSGIAADIRDIVAEAKGQGFVPRIIKRVIALRKKSKEDRQEEEEILELYKAALGME